MNKKLLYMTVLGWPAATYPKLNIIIIIITHDTHTMSKNIIMIIIGNK